MTIGERSSKLLAPYLLQSEYEWGDLVTEEKKHLLDCVGLYCPAPVMNTRTEMDTLEPGALLEVVADDLAALEDIPRWAKRAGHTVVKSWKEGDILHFLIKKKE